MAAAGVVVITGRREMGGLPLCYLPTLAVVVAAEVLGVDLVVAAAVGVALAVAAFPAVEVAADLGNHEKIYELR